MTGTKQAKTKTPKRRTRYAINLRGNIAVRELDDGRWEAHFPLFDLWGYGDTEQAARDDVDAQRVEVMTDASEEVLQRWQEFAEANVIEVEITEEEYRAELAERRKQKRYPSSGLPQLTPKTFDKQVGSSTPTLVDYWATWCEPCHMMAPVLHELKDKLAGQLTVCAVDVEKYEELWERFDLKGVPTLIVFKDGQEVKRILGTRSLDELLGDLEPVLT